MSNIHAASNLFLIASCLILVTYAAHVHVHERGDGHTHTHGGKMNISLVFTQLTRFDVLGHGERVKDGGASPHYKDTGEHNDDFDHEAILGNKKTATEFDTLSPEESKRRLRLLVTRDGMDANGNIRGDARVISKYAFFNR